MRVRDWRPYQRITLHSLLSTNEIMEKLGEHVKPPVHALTPDAAHDESYHGVVHDGHFVIEHGQKFSMAFFPVAKGVIAGAGRGSVIRMQMKLNDVMESVVVAMVVLGAALGLLISMFAGPLLGFVFTAIVLLWVWYSFHFHFRPEAENTLHFLCHVMEAEMGRE